MSIRSRHLVAGGLCALIGVGGVVPAAAALSVTTDERIFVDGSRPTPENGACPALADRTLRTRLWVPGGPCGGSDPCPPYPLFVMAHGYTGHPEKFEGFATAIAAAGFVVAAPAFPLTNLNTPCGFGGGNFLDTAQQPEDVAFVFGELLVANTDVADPLFGVIDPGALTLLGHSLGGVTVDGLLHTDCCTPPPVVASILVAEPFDLTGLFGWSRVLTGPPTLLLQGQLDPIVPLSAAQALSTALPPPRALIGIVGAGHAELLESQIEPPIPARAVAQAATLAFLNAHVRGQSEAFDSLLTQLFQDGHLIEIDTHTVPALSPIATVVLAALMLVPGLLSAARQKARASSSR